MPGAMELAGVVVVGLGLSLAGACTGSVIEAHRKGAHGSLGPPRPPAVT